jgi:hypothetical protein
MENEFAAGGGGVDVLGEAFEANLAVIELPGSTHETAAVAQPASRDAFQVADP